MHRTRFLDAYCRISIWSRCRCAICRWSRSVRPVGCCDGCVRAEHSEAFEGPANTGHEPLDNQQACRSPAVADIQRRRLTAKAWRASLLGLHRAAVALSRRECGPWLSVMSSDGVRRFSSRAGKGEARTRPAGVGGGDAQGGSLTGGAGGCVDPLNPPLFPLSFLAGRSRRRRPRRERRRSNPPQVAAGKSRQRP